MARNGDTDTALTSKVAWGAVILTAPPVALSCEARGDRGGLYTGAEEKVRHGGARQEQMYQCIQL